MTDFTVYSQQHFSMNSAEVKGTLTSTVITANKKTVEWFIDSCLIALARCKCCCCTVFIGERFYKCFPVELNNHSELSYSLNLQKARPLIKKKEHHKTSLYCADNVQFTVLDIMAPIL